MSTLKDLRNQRRKDRRRETNIEAALKLVKEGTAGLALSAGHLRNYRQRVRDAHRPVEAAQKIVKEAHGAAMRQSRVSEAPGQNLDTSSATEALSAVTAQVHPDLHPCLYEHFAMIGEAKRDLLTGAITQAAFDKRMAKVAQMPPPQWMVGWEPQSVPEPPAAPADRIPGDVLERALGVRRVSAEDIRVGRTGLPEVPEFLQRARQEEAA